MKAFSKNIFCVKSDSLSAKRLELIDFLRGGAMILVLLHHSSFPKGDYILAFHMPLLFIISGYVQYILGGYKKEFYAYVKNRFFRLMIPYFMFELLNMLIWFVICNFSSDYVFSLKGCIKSIALCTNTNYGGMYGRLWFLPCMFFADIYTKIILSYHPNKKLWIITAISLFFGISWIITTFCPYRFPMTTDTAFMAAAFILMGHLTGDFIKEITKDRNVFLKILLCVILLLCEVYAIKLGNVSMLMFINSYGEYVVTIFAAICGSLSYLCLMSTIYQILKNATFLKNTICWYGVNSLVTFPVHLTILFVLKRVTQFEWYLLFILTLIFNILIVNFITNYTPFMLGKKK